MTNTSTHQELSKAQADAYRDAREAIAKLLEDAPVTRGVTGWTVYRETMEQEIHNLADLERELLRDAGDAGQ